MWDSEVLIRNSRGEILMGKLSGSGNSPPSLECSGSGTPKCSHSNPVDLMSYTFVNSVTFLVSTERKCHSCDIIELNNLTLTQSNRISGGY